MASSVQTTSLFDEVLARLSLLHELQQLIPAAFGADRYVGHAACGQFGKLGVGFRREVGDAREPAVAVHGGDAGFDGVEYLDKLFVGQDEGVSACQVNAFGELCCRAGDLLDILKDLLHRNQAELLSLLDVAEAAFAM